MSTKSNKKNKLNLPLLEELSADDKSLLNDNVAFEVPPYINDNLIHRMRIYQEEAIRYFYYTQSTKKNRNINHVLFNMATGSGKTDIMAALILFMYEEYGYQNFLFTVNTTGVLKKTIDNLTNKTSNKYLYKQNLEINGNRISIIPVSKFPNSPAKNTIYLKLATVQSLANDLFVISEDNMTEQEYAKNKLVILGDEAHHYSASTKKEKDDEQTWESTINKILNLRSDNRLLEFTATIDLENKNIYEKYKDKVIYRYALDRFMFEKYSKNVRRIESSSNDTEKMLNVILLSEYRRISALELGIDYFKPVIMFKSSNIDTSKNSHKIFNNLIRDLTLESLGNFIVRQQKLDSNESSTLKMAYEYYLNSEERLVQLLTNIKREFDSRRIINANDSDRGGGMLEKGQYEILNTLEDRGNPYRVVFAVAKLTEGWDVLNLYDIVRISENSKGDKKSTMSEAQLIGRGARYNPFILNGSISFKRRFESDSKYSLLLETLHYHTINEPQYLKNLVSSLEALDLPSGKDEKNAPLDVKVKSSFKKTDIYKKGKIYYNQCVNVPETFYSNLSSYGIPKKAEVVVPWTISSNEVEYKDSTMKGQTHLIPIKVDKRYYLKAMQKLKFYNFENLKKYIPLLQSKEEFLYNENWLDIKNLTLRVEVPLSFSVNDLNSYDKLNIIITYLTDIENKVKKGFSSMRGTNKFIGYPIKDYINDYKKRVPQYDTSNNNIPQNVKAFKMNDDSSDWYVYNIAIVNQLEFELINKIGDRINELRKVYPDTYLIRMDEQMNRETVKGNELKLHQFHISDEINFQGFQPDFILYLRDAEYFIQIFIEPKGGDLKRIAKEQWKEELLTYITDNQAEIIFVDEAKDIKIYGLKFYTYNDERDTFKQLARLVLDKDDFDSLSFIEQGRLF